MRQLTDHVHYGYPDHRFSHLVFYIIRKPSSSKGVIQLDEWTSHVHKSCDLVLDEIYPQYNINRERQETWQERGRTRWVTPEGYVRFHFRPSGIGYVGKHRQMDLKTEMQRDRLLKALPEHSTLEDWLKVVERNRYMMQEDNNVPEHAWWTGKKGQKKVLFSWKPAAVWMYQMPASRFYDDPPSPDPLRKMRCEELARDLHAMVELEL